MRIALSGKMGSGKSSIAEQLKDDHQFEILSFGNGIKKHAMEIFGLSWDEVYGDKKNRQLLQDFGRKMREIKPNVWVDYLMAEVNKNPYTSYVVDDVRMPEEFDALKAAGFLMVRVSASESTRKKRLGDKFKNPDDITETALDSIDLWNDKNDLNNRYWDVVISNNGSPEAIKGFSDSLYKYLSKKDQDKDNLFKTP